MSGFTKGPWSVGAADAESGEIEVVSEARPYICLVLPGAIDGLTEANAHLIAAAPELYEAGKRVTDAFRAMGNAAGIVEVRDARIECEQAMLALDAALSKAAGEGV